MLSAARRTLAQGGHRASTALLARRSFCSTHHYEVGQAVEALRRFGHYEAELDPLGIARPSAHQDVVNALSKLDQSVRVPTSGLVYMPAAEATVGEIIQHLRATYCGKASAEYHFIDDTEQRTWLARKMEGGRTELTTSQKKRCLKLLVQAEAFDNFLQAKHPGFKRYSGEGCESMLVCVDAILAQFSKQGGSSSVIGMPHRGRSNLLTTLLQMPPIELFWKVLGNSEVPEGVDGAGDVYSHLATSVSVPTPHSPVRVSLLHNPSHLEAIAPVVLGKVRRKQEDGGDATGASVLPLLIHGDSAISGQGVIQETLNLSYCPDFAVGGSVHVIVNNQVGFTTAGAASRSSRSCSDVARLINAPVFHVNADSPEDVYRVSRLATEFRNTFGKDVFINLVCYRRHGHNEVDEPSFTQPLMYKVIRESHVPTSKQYSDNLMAAGLIKDTDVDKMRSSSQQYLDQQYALLDTHVPTAHHLEEKWSGLEQPRDVTAPSNTGVDTSVLADVGTASVTIPDSVTIHPRLAKLHVGTRLTKVASGKNIDWATAEAMAFGTLMKEGFDVRISGQDVRRGTFSHRHVALVDQHTQDSVIPLNNMGAAGKLYPCNSSLSEFGVLGFEYGYSLESPKCLVLWEAQFGDFANTAQVIIDNFISSGESKWLRQSGLVMLLPHGWDGAGPEHSSSRLERFLQLTDGDLVEGAGKQSTSTNMCVVNVTTPAQYFHVLRRQMNRPFRKPLVVMSPKGLLRLPACVSTLDDMAPGTNFVPVFPDTTVAASAAHKVLICSGKIYYELTKARETHANKDSVAIVRVEELAPFPCDAVRSALKAYAPDANVCWIQEESQNAGAWSFVAPHLRAIVGREVNYIGRGPLAACAVGNGKAHNQEVSALLAAAFS